MPCRIVVSGEVKPLCEEGWSEALDAILVIQIETTIGLDGVHRPGSLEGTPQRIRGAVLVEWLDHPRDPLRLCSCTPGADGYVKIQHRFDGRHVCRNGENVGAADMPSLRSTEEARDR